MLLAFFCKTISSTSLMECKSKSDDHFLRFTGAFGWETWRLGPQAEVGEAWLLMAKKACLGPGLSLSDALDVALCFGWSDSDRKGHDETISVAVFPAMPVKSAVETRCATR